MKSLIYILIALLLPVFSIGQTTWIGTTDTDWHASTNWTAGIPDASDDVTIPNTANHPIIDASLAECYNLTIESAASLTISSTGSLTVNGILTNNAGNSGLILKSDALGTGSLIHSTANVNATVERFLSGEQWHYVSTPINGIDYTDFNTLNFKYWDAAMDWAGGTNTDPWKDYTSTLVNGQGYANYEQENTTTLTGILNQGDYSVPVYRSSTGTANDQGWNLVGNPYPSAINWDSVKTSNINIDDAIYFFEGTPGDYTGTYWSYINGIGTGSATKYIQQGQGFFVKCNNTSGGTLTFNNDDRVHNTQSYWKNDEKTSEIIRLITQGNGLNDETVIRFIDGATYEFDGSFDAYKLLSSDPDVPQLYSLDSAKTTSYSINSLPEITEELAVPLGFKVGPAGEYSISTTEISTDVRYVLLEDLSEDSIIDLRKYPTYLYSFPGGSENENRFILRIKPNSAPTVNNQISDVYTNENVNLSYTFADDVFQDADNDLLVYTATLNDGSALPVWLTFDGDTRTFSGLPESSDVGTWSVALTATDTYWAKDTCFFNIIVESTSSSINNLTEQEFQIYPNPSSGVITFETNNIETPFSFEVYKINGQKVRSGINKIGNSKETLDLSDLPAGIYTIKIRSEGKTGFRKLILMKQ